MSPFLRIFAALSGVVLIVLVMRNVIRKKLQERQSLFWLFVGVLMILVSAFPGVIHFVSQIFGVDYAPSIIFAIVHLVTIYGLFNCYKTNCLLEKQVAELARQVALLNEESTKIRHGKDSEA